MNCKGGKWGESSGGDGGFRAGHGMRSLTLGRAKLSQRQLFTLSISPNTRLSSLLPRLSLLQHTKYYLWQLNLL